MVAPAIQSPVRCPRCSAPGAWHAQANQWGCDHCRQLIGGPPQFPAPFAPIAMPPGPFATQPVPQCPRCWGNATWHAQVGKWGCDRCRSYIDPAAVVAPGSNAGDAGLKVAKILLWVVLIIALIAIKVALRSGRF
jgi:ribosomal protein L37AE/L43A